MDDEQINKIKESLDHYYDWPCVYTFKFIVHTVPNRKDELLNLFSENVEVSSKFSKNAKYISYTIREVILNSDEVLVRYQGASKIEGVMAL